MKKEMLIVVALFATLCCGEASAQLFRRSFARPAYSRATGCTCSMCRPDLYPDLFPQYRTHPAATTSQTTVHVRPAVPSAAGCQNCATCPSQQNCAQQQTGEQAPTPQEAIDAFLALFPLRDSDVLYDLGCGEARVLIAARQRYGCLCVGIEIDPAIADRARIAVYNAGFTPNQIRIVTGDACDYELTGATHIYMYQTNAVLKRFSRAIPYGPIVVSAYHPIPDTPQQRVTTGRHRFYVRMSDG